MIERSSQNWASNEEASRQLALATKNCFQQLPSVLKSGQFSSLKSSEPVWWEGLSHAEALPGRDV